MLVIRGVLVPFWRRLPPEEFRVWFVDNAPRIRQIMLPLGASAAASTSLHALVHRRRVDVLASIASTGIAVVSVTVNERINAEFEGSAHVEPAQLDRWVRWHNVRVGAGVVAAAAAAGSLCSRRAHGIDSSEP